MESPWDAAKRESQERWDAYWDEYYRTNYYNPAVRQHDRKALERERDAKVG